MCPDIVQVFAQTMKETTKTFGRNANYQARISTRHYPNASRL
jgi:hypothetical protein